MKRPFIIAVQIDPAVIGPPPRDFSPLVVREARLGVVVPMLLHCGSGQNVQHMAWGHPDARINYSISATPRALYTGVKVARSQEWAKIF